MCRENLNLHVVFFSLRGGATGVKVRNCIISQKVSFTEVLSGASKKINQ